MTPAFGRLLVQLAIGADFLDAGILLTELRFLAGKLCGLAIRGGFHALGFFQITEAAKEVRNTAAERA